MGPVRIITETARRACAQGLLSLATVALGCAQARAQQDATLRIAASALETGVGEALVFRAEPAPAATAAGDVSYLWRFGDGSQSSEAAPGHSYTALGFYEVEVTRTEGSQRKSARSSIAVMAAPTPRAPARSDRLVLSADGSTLYVTNPDSASVSRVAIDDGHSEELATCVAPQSIALDQSGQRLLITCQQAGALCVLDPAVPTACTMVAVGHRPHGVAVSPSDGRILVANEGDGSVAVLDPEATAVVGRVELGATPRALAIAADGKRAFVSHFLTLGEYGQITPIDLGADTATAGKPLQLAHDRGPEPARHERGYPNLLSTLLLAPDGATLWAGGLVSNSGRGEYVSGELLAPDKRLHGLFAPLDLGSAQERFDDRIYPDQTDSVVGAALSPRGRFAYLLHQGAARLSVYDLAPPTGAVLLSRLDLADAPQGIALSPDGRTGYVMAYLDHSVQLIDLTDPSAPRLRESVKVTAPPLTPRILNGKRLFFRSRAPVHSAGNYIACASCHPDGGHDGRIWDFTQFGEGLRNTIDLRGRAGMKHGPVHWSANFDEIEDFEVDIVDGFGGTGLAMDGAPPHPPLSTMPNSKRSEDLEDLAFFVWSLDQYPKSPHRNADGSMTESALRGRDIFYEPGRGCPRCHLPTRLTDSKLKMSGEQYLLHDVGTLGPGSGSRLGESLEGIDTPTLHGLWAGAPYLHDGSAAMLREVLVERNREDLHGLTTDLDAKRIDDLVAFLLSLDGSYDAFPSGWKPADSELPDAGTPSTVEAKALAVYHRHHHSGCATRPGGAGPHGPARLGALLTLALAVAAGRRRRT